MAKYGFLFLTAALLSMLLTPLVRRLAILVGAVDHPGERRIHTTPTPRMGGLAVYAAVMITVFLTLFVPSELSAVLASDPRLPALGLAVALIVLVGATDDIRSLSPWVKLAVETVAAVIAVTASSFQIPFVSSPLLADAIAIFWIVAVTNAFNLIDGLDGLAAGLGVITSATLVCISIYSSNQEAAIVLMILAGALTGFLRYNFFPSKIFLGDSGSLLLGFLLGVISLSASSRLSAMVAIIVPVLALGLPLVETILTASRRMLAALRVVHIDEETGRYYFAFPTRPGLFTGDRAHIHHRLIDLGFGHRGAVAALYGACILFCSIAFLLVAFRTPFDAVFVAAFGLATMIAIRRLNYGEIQLLRNGTLLPIFELPLINRRILHVLLDLGFVTLSYFSASLIRAEFAWTYEHRFQVLISAPTVVLGQFVALWACGLYRGGHRCTGMGDVLVIGRAVMAATIAGAASQMIVTNGSWPSFTLVLLDGYFLATLVGGSRVAFAMLDYIFKKGRQNGARVLIYGAGRTGLAALHEIQENWRLGMRPVGFVVDDRSQKARLINGYPAISPSRLTEMIERRSFDVLVVVNPRVDLQALLTIVEQCEQAGIVVTRFAVQWQGVRGGADPQPVEEFAYGAPSRGTAHWQ